MHHLYTENSYATDVQSRDSYRTDNCECAADPHCPLLVIATSKAKNGSLFLCTYFVSFRNIEFLLYLLLAGKFAN